MKSYITLLSIIFLIAPHIAFGAQQQQSAEAREFMRQQEAKNRSAQVHAELNLALAMQMQQEENARTQAELRKDVQILAQDDEYAKTMKAWLIENGRDKDEKTPLHKLAELPLPILNLVVEFHYGDPQKLKFIADNMEKLIPSVIEWHSLIFERMDSAKSGILAGQKTAMAKKGFTYFDGQTHINPSNVSAIAQEPNSFAIYGYPNGIMIFKICPARFKLLEALSIQQLQFLASLFDLNTSMAKTLLLRGDAATVRVALTQDQQKMYAELPKEIRDCLDANYGADDVDIMPLEMSVRIRPDRSAQNQQLIAEMLGQNDEQN